jgi:uncharacterized protein YndB with AHSA1/START domain
MSNDAVKAKTSKSWTEWFALLDQAGGLAMTHKEIVRHLVTEHNINDWWSQMVAVTYEQARGLRGKHEKSDGFQISKSKTIQAPAETLFLAFTDPTQRQEWLGATHMTITKSSYAKSLRITMPDTTKLDVQLYPKPNGRTQVVVNHQKIPDSRTAEELKGFWAAALEKLLRKAGGVKPLDLI